MNLEKFQTAPLEKENPKVIWTELTILRAQEQENIQTYPMQVLQTVQMYSSGALMDAMHSSLSLYQTETDITPF